MKHGLPTQIVWERTLRSKNVKQDPATMAWNLFTAIYHKTNNVPWQSETLPEATCFVGISFFRSDPSKPALKTSLAQAFSGRVRVWFSKDREPSQIAKVIPFHI